MVRIKAAIMLHYGKCRIHCFWIFWTKILDLFVSAASLLTILLKMSRVASAMLNRWRAPLTSRENQLTWKSSNINTWNISPKCHLLNWKNMKKKNNAEVYYSACRLGTSLFVSLSLPILTELHRWITVKEIKYNRRCGVLQYISVIHQSARPLPLSISQK